MAVLDPALQALVDQQAIYENWPEDYPYHVLLDGAREEQGRPVIAKVGDDYFSAWLTRDESGAFREVTLLDEAQLGRVFDGRPGADQENRLNENGEFVQTADSANKAEAEKTLSGDEAFATAQFEQVRGRDLIDTAYAPGQLSDAQREMLLAQYPEPTFTFADRAAAEAAGFEFDTTVAVANEATVSAAEDVAASVVQQQADAYAELYGEPVTSPEGGLLDMDKVNARIEQRRAEQAEGSRSEPMRVREQQSNAGAAIIIPDMPDIPVPETVLIGDQERQQYVEQVLGSFETHITSSSANSADGITDMEESLAALRAQLPDMIDPERLRAQIQPQLDAMSAEERRNFEANGGVDYAIKAMQQNVVALSSSNVLNPDLNVAAQDAIDQMRGDMPSMANRAVDASVARLNESLTDRFSRAEARTENAQQAAQEAVANFNETQVNALVEAFRAYKSTPAWEQFREAYAAQGDPNVTEALRRLEEEQTSQPAIPGVKN